MSETKLIRGVVYQAHRSDARARTGDEDGFIDETRGVEEGHGTDERAESKVRSKHVRCQPGQQLATESPVMMMRSSNDHGELDEGDVQVRRWSRLLSWLENHGMDLSPSAFRVERRRRAGIFHPFISLAPEVDIQLVK